MAGAPGSNGGAPGAGGSNNPGAGGSPGTAGSGGSGVNPALPIPLPRVYPPVRATTPSALIANPAYAYQINPFGALALGEVNMATVVQQRLYSGGPTELLRIVKALDDRTGGLDTRPSQHPCLLSTPVPHTFAMPGGQSFTVKLQCFSRMGTGWIAFGFAEPLPTPDAGADAGGVGPADGGVPDDSAPPAGEDASASNDAPSAGDPDATVAADTHADSGGGLMATEGGGADFYLVEGAENGMGGAYHIDRATGDVEGWIAVAEKMVPSNSQVIMHLVTRKAAGTLELSFAGSGVGFCAAHLKTNADHIFISGKTNAPPPPGTPMSATTQYCDAVRSGCFAAAHLDVELPPTDATCAPIAAGTFAISPDLDGSMDPGHNVTPAEIHTLFSTAPAGVPAF
jgi:hypothetical protein